MPISVGKAGEGAPDSEESPDVIAWHGMVLIDGYDISEIRFHGRYLGQFGCQPPKLGRDSALERSSANRARVTISFNH
jgi:hypothetical protein